MVHISKKVASSLWKNEPNSIYLTEVYNGKSSLLLIVVLNINIIQDTAKSRKIAEIVIDSNDIFLNLSGFFSIGDIKYKYRNRSFWCIGYYVDTVGKNAVVIARYIDEQLKEDKSLEQLTLDIIAPFTGNKR